MDDAAIAKLYSEGQSTSHTAALRAVFDAGRKSVADEAAAVAATEKPAAVVVNPRKSSKLATKSKKKK